MKNNPDAVNYRALADAGRLRDAAKAAGNSEEFNKRERVYADLRSLHVNQRTFARCEEIERKYFPVKLGNVVKVPPPVRTAAYTPHNWDAYFGHCMDCGVRAIAGQGTACPGPPPPKGIPDAGDLDPSGWANVEFTPFHTLED